ncbi:type IIL restriction-modification enzyme MmeI [Brevibacterium yomogidense]|uniref:type IIL restriction-modification enzyme MmeI n=1 Tax=Brevibacterium yomogidense TaxID=946573 RepID=UPI00117815E3|nr:type IIL restriction-modification enzyme MmeI [Brevibacterium yomogidense]
MNTVFLGHYTRNSEQADDLKSAWGEDVNGRLDYVTGWHAKTKDLLANRSGEFAYVTTNSITQGLPVPALFGPLYREGWKIKFAHRTFAWDSEAPGKAAVHCVIVGFTKDQAARQRLWDYPNIHGDPVPQRVVTGVNPYLIDGPDLLVKTTTKPLSPTIPLVHYGSMPADGGHLVFKAKEGKRGFDSDPVAAKYLRRFVGASELLHGTERWCLWLEDLTQADLKASKLLRDTIEACRLWRSDQPESGDAYKHQHTPHLFRPSRHVPRAPYLCIPQHVTVNRQYWTAARLEPEFICGNANFVAPDEDGLLFALISSSMFITWLRAVGGRIKSDLRFANTLVWNTFPAPELDEATRGRIIKAGRKVVEARAERPDRSLSELYEPYLLGANASLRKAHNALDTEIDKAFGAPRRLQTEKQRLELLFPAYQALVAAQG